MPVEHLRAQLHLAFKGALPGKEAQLLMAPQPIDPRRIAAKVPEDHRKSGVLLLFYPDASTIYFPLIKRPQYPGAHSGQVALPGGKVEEGDPDVVFTALREAEEERGVQESMQTLALDPHWNTKAQAWSTNGELLEKIITCANQMGVKLRRDEAQGVAFMTAAALTAGKGLRAAAIRALDQNRPAICPVVGASDEWGSPTYSSGG